MVTHVDQFGLRLAEMSRLADSITNALNQPALQIAANADALINQPALQMAANADALVNQPALQIAANADALINQPALQMAANAEALVNQPALQIAANADALVNQPALQMAANIDKVVSPSFHQIARMNAEVGSLFEASAISTLHEISEIYGEHEDISKLVEQSGRSIATSEAQATAYSPDVHWGYVDWFNLSMQMAPLLYRRLLRSTGAEDINPRGRKALMMAITYGLFFHHTGDPVNAAKLMAVVCTIVVFLTKDDSGT